MAQRFNLISPRRRNDKTYWHNVGSAFPREAGGFSLVFDSLPLPDAEGRVTVLMTEPLPDDRKPEMSGKAKAADAAQRPMGQGSAMDEDSIPFAMEWR